MGVYVVDNMMKMEQLTIFDQPESTKVEPKKVQWRTRLEEQGIVLTGREKECIDRMDLLPRKTGGVMHYIYKPANTYPARIYVFVHGDDWRDRNKRPMGLLGAAPFLSRPMNSEEIEDHHFDTRMCYRQYESFDKLMKRERWEAEFSNIDTPGSGDEFIKKLEAFKHRYIR